MCENVSEHDAIASNKVMDEVQRSQAKKIRHAVPGILSPLQMRFNQSATPPKACEHSVSTSWISLIWLSQTIEVFWS